MKVGLALLSAVALVSCSEGMASNEIRCVGIAPDSEIALRIETSTHGSVRITTTEPQIPTSKNSVVVVRGYRCSAGPAGSYRVRMENAQNEEVRVETATRVQIQVVQDGRVVAAASVTPTTSDTTLLTW